jgi:carbonic anhydrase
MEVINMSTAETTANSEAIIKNLNESVMNFYKNFPLEQFAAVDFKQHPAITLLTCSDARMPADIFGPLFNNIFCVENIGNQFQTSAGSVLYGLLHLHTPIMIIAGHSDCGAIKSSQSNFVDEPLSIRNELSIVKNSLEDIILKTGLKLEDTPLKSAQLAELNVDMQINYLLANAKAAGLIGGNRLLVAGVFVDLHNVHNQGYGKVYTVNINGEHKSEVLKTYTNLGTLADQARRLVNY